MPSKSLPIKCDSAADLQKELSVLQSPLQLVETEETWEKIATAFSRLGALAQAGACDYPASLVPFLRSISRPTANAATSERSRLASTAIAMLSYVAQGLGKGFEPLLHLYLPVLLAICGRPNKVFVARARAGVETIIESTQLPSILPYLVNSLADKSISMRQTAISGILACLNCFNPPDLEKEARALDIENAIRTTATDANGDVRRISRKVFDAYRILLPDRVDTFTYPLSSTAKKYLNIATTATSRPGSSMSSHSTRSIVIRPGSAMPSVPRADEQKAPPQVVHGRNQSSSIGSAKPFVAVAVHTRLVGDQPDPSKSAPNGSRGQGSRPPPKLGQSGNRPIAGTDKCKAMRPPPTVPLRRSHSVAARLRPGPPPQPGPAKLAPIETSSNPRRGELDQSTPPTRYCNPSIHSESSGKDTEPLKPSKNALQMAPPLRPSQDSMDKVTVGARRVPMPPKEIAIKTPVVDSVVPDQNTQTTSKGFNNATAPTSSTSGLRTKGPVRAKTAKATEPSRHATSSSSVAMGTTGQKMRGRDISQPTLSQLARMKATATERKLTSRTTTTQARAGAATSKAKSSGRDSVVGSNLKPNKSIEILMSGPIQTAQPPPQSVREEMIDPKEVSLPDSRPPSPISEANERQDMVRPGETRPSCAVPNPEPVDNLPSPTSPKSPISNVAEVAASSIEPSEEIAPAEKTPIKSSVPLLNGDITSNKTPISALLSSIQRGFMFTPGSPLSPPHSYGQDVVDENYRDDESIMIQGWN
ncbi:hypothetical protein DENSPDRAFT_873056 [Dentipellis sp. KUC8613]|nr:hypothetical protein DENSPDRAFT_873056 [Dentipellis sp. KUC8613]